MKEDIPIGNFKTVSKGPKDADHLNGTIVFVKKGSSPNRDEYSVKLDEGIKIEEPSSLNLPVGTKVVVTLTVYDIEP